MGAIELELDSVNSIYLSKIIASSDYLYSEVWLINIPYLDVEKSFKGAHFLDLPGRSYKLTSVRSFVRSYVCYQLISELAH